MTREYRDWLRAEIDKAKRVRLSRARLRDPSTSRAAYYAAWHTANRDRRLDAQRARRQRLKDAA